MFCQIQRAEPVKKTQILGKVKGGEGGDRECDVWMASLTHWASLSKPRKIVKGRGAVVLQSRGRKELDTT